MNFEKLNLIIQLYKKEFDRINRKEIYKWQAVKCFQDNWDIKSRDFGQMLENSLRMSKNLLNSNNYFPQKMIVQYASLEPERMRMLFSELYNEEEDLVERAGNFQKGVNEINHKHFEGKNSYQDRRAVLVYLCLKYPERYYLFKHEMFKNFAPLIDFGYSPKKGTIEQVLQYLTMCALIRAEIVKDGELLKLHKTRLGEKEYSDPEYNLLTQDIIYSATRHLNFENSSEFSLEPASLRLTKREIDFTPIKVESMLKGSFINHIENAKRNKQIGDLGEILVFEYEKERLTKLNVERKPFHSSKDEGDGLGYDILSYDEKGKPIYIEVKTTLGSANTPFFLTSNEINKSKESENSYFLYRLFNFDEKKSTADFFIYKGDLSQLTPTPIGFKVSLRID